MNRFTLILSARMACIMGILLPLLETIRRSNQILDPRYFIHWFDDYLLGGILLLAAWSVFRRKSRAPIYLLIAWSMAAGVLLMSLLYQLDLYFNPGTEPGVFSMHLVAIVKGLILGYILLGLWKCIQAMEQRSSPP